MKKAGATNGFTSRACKGYRKRSRGSKPLCHARSTRSWRIISNAKATPKRSNFWNNVARPSRPCSHRQDAEATCLARIQLDDQLLVDHRLHLFARGDVSDFAFERVAVDRQPIRHGHDLGQVEVAHDELTRFGLVFDRDLVAGFDVVGSDI